MAAGAEEIRALIADSFGGSRAPDGEPWEPLAPATIARRRGSSSKPLLDTGRLANSITAEPSRTALTFGTNVEYAGPHQLGTADIPQRRFLPVDRLGGKWMLDASGPAGKSWARVSRYIARYIATGRVS